MSIAYVIHCDADLDFVKNTLLRSLPCNGFERWVSSTFLKDPQTHTIIGTMKDCDVIFAVMSPAAADSTDLASEITNGRTIPTPMIAVQAADLTDEECARFPEELSLLPLVDLRHPGPDARRELAALLPIAGDDTTTLSDVTQPIEWNEEIFSEALADALKLRQHQLAETLIENLAEHIKDRPYPYPSKHAINDLKMLRRKRQFRLMRRYGDAVLASGTQDEEVRRQYAQALIEQREFDKALEMLNSILDDPKSRADEVEEAYGLKGRTYKQQYQDNPDGPGSHEFLRKAIESYGFVYDKDPSKLWHGINKASCIVRAYRDGITGVQLSEAKSIAENLLKEIERLGEEKYVWDYATRVEALIILERYEEALTAVNEYINHPGMDAFEVSSTYRQFDQLLKLGQEPRGKLIIARLLEAVQHHRGVDFADQSPAPPSGESVGSEQVTLPLLIRVTDPNWQPGDVTDLVIEGRMGLIVTAHGSAASVKELMSDPDVSAVNDSHPAGAIDCVRSVPYIRVADNYPGPGGPYTEKGAHALVAIIDSGIDVLHQAFLDDQGKSRIVGIWDQTDTTGPQPPGFSYGTYHSNDDVMRYIKNNKTEKKLGRDLRDRHGTHVASIAAGRKAGDFAGGVAPEARLLIVIADGQSSTGYSKSHVDALVFIDKTASQLKLPVVVNLSQGMNAGAHDGSSLVEAAFNQFAADGRRPGRVVVKSAGNERHKHGHAKVTVAPSSIETLTWRRDPKGVFAERLELWWDSHDEFEFRLSNPSSHEWTPWVGIANQKQQGVFADDTRYLLEFTPSHVDNGDGQLLIVIGEGLSPVPAGSWELEIRGGIVPKGGIIDAWIERGVGEPSSFTNHISEENTLSIPGTADTVITVGAIEAVDPTRVGKFSSYGPTRDKREKPDLAAPGIGVQAARAGSADGILTMDGTSMAAPHVTGAIALLLSRRAATGQQLFAASQITKVLQRKTINYSGRWDRGQGYGILDVAALLAAFP